MINRDKVEKGFIVILSIGLIVMIVWKFNIIGLLKQRKQGAVITEAVGIWMENAKENLKEDFLFMEGESYFFAKGRLKSECTELDPTAHCPMRVFKANINDDELFVDGFRFANNSGPDIFPDPPHEGISALGFLSRNSNENVSLEFEILDYIPNKDLCVKPHDKQELCNVRWTKKIPLNEPILTESLLVKITNFDYSFSNQELNISLNGEIDIRKEPEANPTLCLIDKSMKFLKDETDLDLQYKDGVYAFEFNGTFENVRPNEQNYSILLLITSDNSFYAKEWVFDGTRIGDTITYN